MQTFNCYLVSENDPSFQESVPFDSVPRTGDFLLVEGHGYRVTAVLHALAEHRTHANIYLSVEPVAIPFLRELPNLRER